MPAKKHSSERKVKPRAHVVGRSLDPVVGHLPKDFNPFSALYRVSLSCKIAMDALDGKTKVQANATPIEYALYNICSALDDLSKAVAFFNKPNPSRLWTGHLVHGTQHGVVQPSESNLKK